MLENKIIITDHLIDTAILNTFMASTLTFLIASFFAKNFRCRFQLRTRNFFLITAATAPANTRRTTRGTRPLMAKN